CGGGPGLGVSQQASLGIEFPPPAALCRARRPPPQAQGCPGKILSSRNKCLQQWGLWKFLALSTRDCELESFESLESVPRTALRACGGGCRAKRGGWGLSPRVPLLRHPHPNPPPRRAGEGGAACSRRKRLPLPRIERVAQAVADQIERQHHQEDCQSRP